MNIIERLEIHSCVLLTLAQLVVVVSGVIAIVTEHSYLSCTLISCVLALVMP
jgi:hypothetical protein